jgi:hypothetical protein
MNHILFNDFRESSQINRGVFGLSAEIVASSLSIVELEWLPELLFIAFIKPNDVFNDMRISNPTDMRIFILYFIQPHQKYVVVFSAASTPVKGVQNLKVQILGNYGSYFIHSWVL